LDAQIILIVAGAAAAGFVQGLSGFGFSLVAMSFWAWSIDPKLAAVMAVFGGLAGQVMAAFTVSRNTDWKQLLPFLAGGLLGLPLGLLLLPRLDVQLFKLFLGVLLALWCPAMLFSGKLPRVHHGGRIADGTIGVAGGFMGALGGFSGVIPTLWCTLRGYEKSAQRAVIQNFNLAVLTVTMASYVAAGLVSPRDAAHAGHRGACGTRSRLAGWTALHGHQRPGLSQAGAEPADLLRHRHAGFVGAGAARALKVSLHGLAPSPSGRRRG
jgi:uncharacterized membrane protein YfcA